MKMNDWLGRYVELDRDIRTCGGALFSAGTVLLVYGHHRGRLQLEDVRGRFYEGRTQMRRGPSVIRVRREGLRLLSLEEVTARGALAPERPPP